MVGLKTKNLSLQPADAPVQIEEVSGVTRVHVPAGCRASLIDQTESRLEVTVADGAQLSYYKLVNETPLAIHQSFLEVQVQKQASFQSNVFLFGGAQIRSTIHVRMDGEGAECALNGLYVGSGSQIIEMHTLIDHIKPHGTSREFYKGILDDKARGLFDGLIIVQKEAQKTDSAQTNKNLLLSTEARANSNPELKIFANDVKCKHGSTVGQINANSIFYLRSRGVPEAEARQLLIYAFASEMIEPVVIPEFRETLFQCLNSAISTKK